MKVQSIPIGLRSPEEFAPLIGPERAEEGVRTAERLAKRLSGRTVWHINSTARGGGVAEMLPSLLAFARGAGIDTRWLVISGDPEFFEITKRLHNFLHGAPGDGGPLGDDERAHYELTLSGQATELDAMIRGHDIVFLHDPQCAGLIPHLHARGVRVIWRCHIGTEIDNDRTQAGWDFLARYVGLADACVFTRSAYVPDCCDPSRVGLIAPSIDPFSPKNEDLDPSVCRAILFHAGILGTDGGAEPLYRRADGSPGRVDRCADVQRLGGSPDPSTPLIVQVSRWDRLKDPLGVLQGFAHLVSGYDGPGELVLAGPSVRSIADDPEGGAVYAEVLAAWRELPHALRRRVQLVALPMADVDENAAIVNALQRHAAVVVQKSLREGFGLTVTEAMWKGRPVVASAVGGIQDQVEDGTSGLLVKDPRDLEAFAEALRSVLTDPALASRLGRRARERVIDRFLGATSLIDYARLIERVDFG